VLKALKVDTSPWRIEEVAGQLFQLLVDPAAVDDKYLTGDEVALW
jgi:hypothetical protein